MEKPREIINNMPTNLGMRGFQAGSNGLWQVAGAIRWAGLDDRGQYHES